MRYTWMCTFTAIETIITYTLRVLVHPLITTGDYYNFCILRLTVLTLARTLNFSTKRVTINFIRVVCTYI